MTLKRFQAYYQLILLVLFGNKTCGAVDVDCNFDLKVFPGQPIRLSNYGWKFNRLLTNCQWHIYSDTRVRLNCYTSNVAMSRNCANYKFYIFSGDKMRSTPHRYCGENFSTMSEKNSMFVTLVGPTNIPEGAFLCKFQTTEPLTIAQCKCGMKNPTKIIGGDETGVNEYPMMAGLIYNKNQLEIPTHTEDVFCGGTIISPRHIITAAHCIIRLEVRFLGVLVGDHDLTTNIETSKTRLYRAYQKVIHPYYDYTNNYNDVAIVTIKDSIKFTNEIGPACLPFQHRRYSFENYGVNILGWGIMGSIDGKKARTLQKATVGVTNFQLCQRYQPNLIVNQICTYAPNKDSCQMDSGGPVLWQNPQTRRLVLIGIINFGKGCANSSPGINARVSSFLDWILQNTQDVTYCRSE